MKLLTLLLLSLTVLPSAAQSERRDSLALQDSLMLEEVTIVAQRPLVKQEADRVAYDVKNDEESKTATIMEMLRKVPYVTVDGQDNITIKGSSNFEIYKNGRPNKSFTGNAKQVLTSIPASAVKRIEVITEPGAKYSAEGLDGILNIVMDDEMKMAGFVGNASVSYQSTGHLWTGLWGTVQAGGFTLSGNVGVNRQSSKSAYSTRVTETNYQTSGNTSLLHRTTYHPGNVGYANLEASYEIDSLNLLTASLQTFAYDIHSLGDGNMLMSAADGTTLYGYDEQRMNGDKYAYYDLDAHIDYQHLTHRKGETLNFSYMISASRTHSRESLLYSNVVNYPTYSRMTSDGHRRFTEHTFQLDYTLPTWDNQTLDLGAKYILRLNSSDAMQAFDDQLTSETDFSHTTQVAALYAQYKWQYKTLALIGGLRYEYSHLKADFSRQLNDWVPSFTASWRLADAQTLRLNYAMRLNRPGISYLNPARYVTTTSISEGNPHLESSQQHNVTLSYSLTMPKLSFNTSLYTRLSNDQLMSLQYVEDEIIHYTYDNCGRMRTYGMTAYAQWKPFEGTTWMMNGDVSYNDIENPLQRLQNRRWAYSVYTSVTQKLPWKLQLMLSVYNNISQPSLYSYTRRNWWGHQATLQRSFLKDDRLTMRLFMGNLLQPRTADYTTRTTEGEITGVSSYMGNPRYVGLSASIRIGSLNATVKKTAKTVSNDDLQGRR